MGFLKTLLGWASGAWGAIFGAAVNPVDALTKLWHYITSVHDVVAWLMRNPVVRFYATVLQNLTALGLVLAAARDALRRLAAWLWLHEVKPVRDQLVAEIAALRAWAVKEFNVVLSLIEQRYLEALAYTLKQVGAERAQRIQAVRAEHAAMLAGDKATLATVQRQAAGAYNAGTHDRIGVAGDLLNDLVTRTPIIKDLVNLVIKGALDLADIENPELAWLINKAVDEIVAKVGIDQLAAQAAQSLLAPIIGGKRATGLHDAIADLDARLQAMEKQWATFMQDGGPEVEQAGEQWKGITGIIADVGVLGFVGLAAADPAAWSQGIADTIGTAGNDALTAVVDLIGRV